MFTGNNLVQDQIATIVDSTISGNSAGMSGGGIFNFDGRLFVRRSTITDNQSAASMGGGIASRGDDNGVSTTVGSSIVSGNLMGADLAIVGGIVNSLVSEGYNLVGTGNSIGTPSPESALDNFTATGDQTGIINPGLRPLADNGGPTKTHALTSTSPALDRGNPIAVAGLDGIPEFDQRGTPFGRIKDGNRDETARIDIGAFESPPHSADFDQDGDVDGADFLAWMRNFNATPVTQTDGDANNDETVDSGDLLVWQDQYGSTPPTLAARQSPAPVQAESRSPPEDVDLSSLVWQGPGSQIFDKGQTLAPQKTAEVVGGQQASLPVNILSRSTDGPISAEKSDPTQRETSNISAAQLAIESALIDEVFAQYLG